MIQRKKRHTLGLVVIRRPAVVASEELIYTKELIQALLFEVTGQLETLLPLGGDRIDLVCCHKKTESER